MIETACAFTGHRPKSFPWGYDETASGCVLLKKILSKQISAMADDGVYRSGTGMTVRYAQSKHRKIILIHPITREVSSINGEL